MLLLSIITLVLTNAAGDTAENMLIAARNAKQIADNDPHGTHQNVKLTINTLKQYRKAIIGTSQSKLSSWSRCEALMESSEILSKLGRLSENLKTLIVAVKACKIAGHKAKLFESRWGLSGAKRNVGDVEGCLSEDLALLKEPGLNDIHRYYLYQNIALDLRFLRRWKEAAKYGKHADELLRRTDLGLSIQARKRAMMNNDIAVALLEWESKSPAGAFNPDYRLQEDTASKVQNLIYKNLEVAMTEEGFYGKPFSSADSLWALLAWRRSGPTRRRPRHDFAIGKQDQEAWPNDFIPPPEDLTKSGVDESWKDSPERCDIDRRESLSLSEFQEEYANKGRPVIIKPDQGKWVSILKEKWTSKSLGDDHGNTTVTTMPGSNITMYFMGMGAVLRARKQVRDTSLLSHMHGMKTSGKNHTIDADYQFDGAIKLKGLLDSIDLMGQSHDTGPVYMSAGFSWDNEHRRKKALFGIGAIGSGATWHTHTSAFNYQAYGRKLWILAIPETEQVNKYASTMHFLHNQLPNTGGEELRCTQGPGELLFLPQAWSHATLNLQASVSLAIEVGVWGRWETQAKNGVPVGGDSNGYASRSQRTLASEADTDTNKRDEGVARGSGGGEIDWDL